MEEKLDEILRWTDKCIITRIMREPTSEDAFIVDMRLRLTEAFAEEIKRQILELIREARIDELKSLNLPFRELKAVEQLNLMSHVNRRLAQLKKEDK